MVQQVATVAFEGIEAVARDAGDVDDGLPVDERIHQRILLRKKEGIEALLDEAIGNRRVDSVSQSDAAVGVLNEVLLPAMKDVGDRFGAGELILPFVLQSAEVMKRAVSHLEQYLEKQTGYTKGTIVVATVYGDEPAHRGRAHVLGRRQLTDRAGPAEYEYGQHRQPCRAEATGGVLPAGQSQHVDGGTLDAAPVLQGLLVSLDSVCEEVERTR